MMRQGGCHPAINLQASLGPHRYSDGMTQRLTPGTVALLVTAPLLWAGNAVVGRLVHDLVGFDKMLCCHDSPLRQVLIESAERVTGPPGAPTGTAPPPRRMLTADYCRLLPQC